jgi:hypothetical protein
VYVHTCTLLYFRDIPTFYALIACLFRPQLVADMRLKTALLIDL